MIYSAEAVAAREALITGQPPRSQSEPTAEAVKAAQVMLAKMRGMPADAAATAAREDIPPMLLTMMCHPSLSDAYANLSTALMKNGALSARDRELLVLRATWLFQVPYAYGEHVRIGRRVGLSSEDVENIIVGSSSAYWSEYDRALLAAAEELVQNTMISDATWSLLVKYLDEKQLFELPILVGQFAISAYLQNSFRFSLSEGNDGLLSR